MSALLVDDPQRFPVRSKRASLGDTRRVRVVGLLENPAGVASEGVRVLPQEDTSGNGEASAGARDGETARQDGQLKEPSDGAGGRRRRR